MIWLIISLKLLVSNAAYTYSGFKYGDHVNGWKYAGGGSFILDHWFGIADSSACSQLCENYVPPAGGDKCNTWDFKPSQNNLCGIGHGDPPYVEDQFYTSGLNVDVCDDAVNCNQNSVCSSWTEEEWDISGAKRKLSTGRCYYAYVPSVCQGPAANDCKVVFNFGGVKRNAKQWADDRIGFTNHITGQAGTDAWSDPGIVIYPQKFPTIGGWQYFPGRSGLCTQHDDVNYVYNILNDLTTSNINWDGGVYAVGHGNGGHFVFDLAARLENNHGVALNAIGTYSGNSLTDHGGTVQIPTTSLHVLIVQGYNDATHEYWGHQTKGCDMGKVDSQALANWWGAAMKCDPDPVVDACHTNTCGVGPDEKERHYEHCDSDVDVVLKSPNSGYSWTSAGDTIFSGFFRDH